MSDLDWRTELGKVADTAAEVYNYPDDPTPDSWELLPVGLRSELMAIAEAVARHVLTAPDEWRKRLLTNFTVVRVVGFDRDLEEHAVSDPEDGG